MIEVFFSISAADWEVFPIRVSDFKPCHSCFWLTLISTPSPSPLPLLPLPHHSPIHKTLIKPTSFTSMLWRNLIILTKTYIAQKKRKMFMQFKIK